MNYNSDYIDESIRGGDQTEVKGRPSLTNVQNFTSNVGGTEVNITNEGITVNETTIEASSMPAGYLIGGKLSVSCDSGTATISIKTLAGSNPSSSSPVKVRIGNTEKTITSATSLSLAPSETILGLGTGGVDGEGVDLFVFLFIEGSSLRMGVSRIPYAWGNFSSYIETSGGGVFWNGTGDYYSSDEYCVVGRTGFYYEITGWSEDTSPGNLVSSPIFSSRLQAFRPQTIGFETDSDPFGQYCYYKITNETVHMFLSVSGTSNDTGFTVYLPVPASDLASCEGSISFTDNDVVSTSPGKWDVSGDGVILYTDFAAGGWTNSGGKSATGLITYNVN